MLTKRQNLSETITGGHPDRYVNQYEALGIVLGNPITGGMDDYLESVTLADLLRDGSGADGQN